MKFHPKNIFNISDIKQSNLKYGLMVLNRPILVDKELIELLWNQSMINITVDGGANRWLDWLKKHNMEQKMKPPCLITGDLDSCRPETLKYFSKTEIISTPDQDNTDFSKALTILDSLSAELQISHVIVVCESSGRFDQILANINTLFMYNQKSKEIQRPIYILSSNSITWLLPVTDSNDMHEIYIPENVKKFWCSLIPIGNEATVTTKGLKWNLDNDIMKFGGIVSTSNTYDGISDTVRISTNIPLVWSMGIEQED